MASFSLFRRSKREAPKAVAERDAAAPKRSVVTLGVDENGRHRGIFKDERIHMAVVGFPGSGKSRFILSLALQNVRDGEGLLIVDPHGDLAKLFLSHVPRNRWDDVIYIDPMTARNYGKVVKINFLECPDMKDRDVVARSFMESLEKIYARFWGPRLDMILMNAIYTLLDAGNTNLSNLYSVIADENFREMLLERVSDDKVRNFWESEFKRMTKDASSAALTKIYRIVQERIVAPMFDCIHSRIDFRKAMDQRKIMVVNLSEGAITSDVANFLGSLILARVYLAGMSREDTPEDRRVPFYVYVDEAYRFVSLSIRDILQSLRKYRVYMTLASQYLGQYSREIADSIPHLCDAIICFTVGEETARALEEFYRPSLTYLDLVHLPKFAFAASVMVGGVRECQVLRSVDCGQGSTDVEELVRHSLKLYGEEVDMSKYAGVPAVGPLSHPTDVGFKIPLPWSILVALYRLYVENLGISMTSQGSFPFMDREGLIERLRQDFGISEVEVDRALNDLSYANYIATRSHTYSHEVIPIPAEPPLRLTPSTCVECGNPTSRPFTVRGGRDYCRFCLERALLKGDVTAADIEVPAIDPQLIRRDKADVRRVTKNFYAITPYAKGLFFEQVPFGARGGGPEHTRAIGAIVRMLLKDYCYFAVDVGEEAPRKTAEGREEYEMKKRPDIVVCPIVRGRDGKLDPRHWDTGHMFTVEVEMDPIKHRQRVINNLKKNMSWGKPVVFATTRLKWANDLVDILLEHGEKVVRDNTGLYGGVYDAKSVSVLYIDPDSETRTFVTPEVRLPAEEPAEEAPGQRTQAPTQVPEHVPMQAPVQTPAQTPVQAPAPRAEGEAAEQPPVVKLSLEFQLDDLGQLLSIFDKQWSFEMRLEGNVQILYAKRQVMGKTVKVKIGPYEQFKRQLSLLEGQTLLVPQEEVKAEAKGRLETPSTEAPPAEPLAGQISVEEKPAVAPAQPTVEAAQKGGAEGPRVKIEEPLITGYEGKILSYKKQGYGFSVKRIKDRYYLYAQKRTEGKVDSKTVAPWNDEVRNVVEKLGISVKTT